MAEGVAELRRLTPEERLRRLKELEEERRKEIEEAEELIKETRKELEGKAEEKKNIPIPQARATDIDTLTTAEEKEIVKTHHFVADSGNGEQQAPQQSLEAVAEEESETKSAQQGRMQLRQPGRMYGSEASAGGPGQGYSSASVTAAAEPGRGQASPIEREVSEFYSQRGQELSDEERSRIAPKYSGMQGSVTGGYEMRKAEQQREKEVQETYRRHGPA